MAADVYAWPPVALAAWDNDMTRPGSLSFDQGGASFYSQAQASRQIYDAAVLSVGRHGDNLGYLKRLRRFLDGKSPLVRISPEPALWWNATRHLARLRGQVDVNLFTTGRDTNMTDGGIATNIKTGAVIAATAVADGIWDGIACTGLPPSQVVALPDELVRAETGETARVVKRERSDASGAATIRLDGPIPTGNVVIGAGESKVMLILNWGSGRAGLQPVTRDFQMREVFASDFPGGFNEIDPWH